MIACLYYTQQVYSTMMEKGLVIYRLWLFLPPNSKTILGSISGSDMGFPCLCGFSPDDPIPPTQK